MLDSLFVFRRSGDGRGDDTLRASARHRATSEEQAACYKPNSIFDTGISARAGPQHGIILIRGLEPLPHTPAKAGPQ